MRSTVHGVWLRRAVALSGKTAVSNGQKPLLTVAAVTEVNYPRLRCIRAWGGAPSLFGSRPQIVHLKKDQERRSSPSRATLDHTPSLRALSRDHAVCSAPSWPFRDLCRPCERTRLVWQHIARTLRAWHAAYHPALLARVPLALCSRESIDKLCSVQAQLRSARQQRNCFCRTQNNTVSTARQQPPRLHCGE